VPFWVACGEPEAVIRSRHYVRPRKPEWPGTADCIALAIASDTRPKPSRRPSSNRRSRARPLGIIPVVCGHPPWVTVGVDRGVCGLKEWTPESPGSSRLPQRRSNVTPGRPVQGTSQLGAGRCHAPITSCRPVHYVPRAAGGIPVTQATSLLGNSWDDHSVTLTGVSQASRTARRHLPQGDRDPLGRLP
jgi:hypothetical protein